MLDNKLLRQDLPGVVTQLQKRGFRLDIAEIEALENDRKRLQQETETLQKKRNTLSKAIGIAKAEKSDTTALFKQTEGVNEQLAEASKNLEEIQQKQKTIFLQIPNLPDSSVPEGATEEHNLEIKKWGKPRQFDFVPKDHVGLTEKSKDLDFESASKISGARFVVMKKNIAKLHRALIQFMLNLHVEDHGYEERYVPYIVNIESLYASGQMPKMAEDLFILEGQSHALIPTAEVPLVNLVRDLILEEKALPKKWVAHTPSFRKEAGSYGKDTRGMLRHHQFDKVELVQIVRPEDSKAALEEILIHAENVLKILELPYRVVSLCGGDLGFNANKTYDIEVWLPSEARYREISSCSNTDAFQARRMQARFRRSKTQKIELLHTLNGSGLAVGRTLIAVLENYQQADGSVLIPKALQPLMNQTVI